jgi:pimeloyl-ACP methyl ester carboxylesterase
MKVPAKANGARLDRLALFLVVMLVTSAAMPSNLLAPPSGGAFYPHEGVRIHYKDIGAGRPVVFLHGFGASMDSWRFLPALLGSGYRSIAVDLKGHGYSGKPLDGKYSLEDHARAVIGLVRHLGLERIVLVGHSYGSIVALAAALEDRASVQPMISGLALISASIDSGRLPFFLKLARLPVLGWLAVKATPVSFRTRLMLKRVYHDDSKVTDDLVDLYAKYQRMPGAEEALMSTARQMVPSDMPSLVEGLRKLDLPVVNIWGSQDKVISRAAAEGVCNVLPQCELVEIANVGHLPQEEAPEKVAALLREFVRKIDGEAGVGVGK